MITSNIDDVIRRLEGTQKRLPIAIRQAVSPKAWELELHTIARETLIRTFESAPMTEDEEAGIIAILGTYAIAATESGFSVTLGGIAQNELVNRDEAGRRIPHEKLMEWVMTYKELRDDRDPRLPTGEWDYERIATNVFFAMRADPEPWWATDEPRSGALDPTGLVQFSGLIQSTPARVQAGLQAVLTAWRAHAIQTAPGRVLGAMHDAITRV